MNWRGIPIISTAIVLAAVAVMTGLGFWQLDRLDQKEALIARYKAAPTDAARIDYPAADQIEQELYRKVRAECAEVASILGVAGNNSLGVSGFSHVADCTLKGGEEAKIALGWSRNPQSPDWQGGEVLGILAPGGKIVAVPGGVLVKDNGTIIGAVGVTGDTSDNDETCAIAGIAPNTRAAPRPRTVRLFICLPPIDLARSRDSGAFRPPGGLLLLIG